MIAARRGDPLSRPTVASRGKTTITVQNAGNEVTTAYEPKPQRFVSTGAMSACRTDCTVKKQKYLVILLTLLI
jgi:hypothetical protein